MPCTTHLLLNQNRRLFRQRDRLRMQVLCENTVSFAICVITCVFLVKCIMSTFGLFILCPATRGLL